MGEQKERNCPACNARAFFNATRSPYDASIWYYIACSRKRCGLRSGSAKSLNGARKRWGAICDASATLQAENIELRKALDVIGGLSGFGANTRWDTTTLEGEILLRHQFATIQHEARAALKDNGEKE